MKLRTLLALPALTALAYAQTATPPAAPAAPQLEETLVLDVFNVSATSGYTASDTSTGARMGVKLDQHPYTVNVVTSDFIKDFSGVELREWFAYTPGLAVQEGEGNYSVRGQRATGALRNGFLRSGMIDSVMIERAEVIKGPSAAIYGRTAPGGLVNIITKKAPATPMASFSQQIGGYGYYRTQVSAGGPVVRGKLFMRFDGAIQEQDETFDHYSIKNYALSQATLWKISQNTSLTVELEYVQRDDSTDSELRTPWIWTANTDNNNAGTQTSNPDWSMKTFNYESGSKEVTGLTRKTYTTFANLDHKINDVFSFRLGGFVADRPATRKAYDGERWVPSLRTFYNRAPLFRWFTDRADGFQADLTAVFETGPVKHRMLLTGDYLFQTQSDQIYRLPSSLLTNNTYNRRTLNVDNPDYWFPAFDPSVYTTSGSGRDQGSTVTFSGGFISDRVSMLNESLNIMAGVRYTHLNSSLFNRNTTNPLQAKSETTTSDYDPQFGFTYKIVEPLTVFASYATSTREQTRIATDPAGNIISDPEKGKGLEYGIKSTALKGRLTVTASYFDQDRTNIIRTDPDNGTNVLSGEENSHGFEVQAAYSITDNWQILASGTSIKARITQPDRATLLIFNQAKALGLTDYDRTLQSPETQYSLAMRYDFKKGALKGLKLNGGYRFYGEQLTNNTNITNIRYEQDAYKLLDLGASYTFKAGMANRLSHTFRLNVKNVLDDEWFFGDRKLGRGTQFILGYEIAFK